MPELTNFENWTDLEDFIDRRIGLLAQNKRESYAFVLHRVWYDTSTERWALSSRSGATFFQTDGWRIVTPQSLHL